MCLGECIVPVVPELIIGEIFYSPPKQLVSFVLLLRISRIRGIYESPRSYFLLVGLSTRVAKLDDEKKVGVVDKL